MTQPLTKSEYALCILLLTKDLAETRALLHAAIGYHLPDHRALSKRCADAEVLLQKLVALRGTST